MTANLTQDNPQGRDITSVLKSWMMVAVTLIFVALYSAAVTGWLKPMADEKMVTHLEPIIFVIIGYYFGRLPAQQNERTLKEEIVRQIQKADAAQHAKEQSQQARETLEERIKNAGVILAATASGAALKSSGEHIVKIGGQIKDEALTNPVATALKVLNS